MSHFKANKNHKIRFVASVRLSVRLFASSSFLWMEFDKKFCKTTVDMFRTVIVSLSLLIFSFIVCCGHALSFSHCQVSYSRGDIELCVQPTPPCWRYT